MVKGRENWPKFKKSDDETLIKMNKCGSNMLEIWTGNLTSNQDIWRVEAPSAFMHGNGRSLGKLAAYMANGGTFEGKCLLNEEAYNKFHAEKTRAPFCGTREDFEFS